MTLPLTSQSEEPYVLCTENTFFLYNLYNYPLEHIFILEIFFLVLLYDTNNLLVILCSDNNSYSLKNLFIMNLQPRLYVGRGMQETQVSVFKYSYTPFCLAFYLLGCLFSNYLMFNFLSCRYTLFWVLVLSSKFLFSYSFEVSGFIVASLLRSNVTSLDLPFHGKPKFLSTKNIESLWLHNIWSSK